MKKCPFCAEEIQAEAIKCRFCGEFFAHDSDNRSPSGSSPQPSGRIGTVLITFGALLGIYYVFIFDTSVQIPRIEMFGSIIGGDRVNNLGLLSQKQNGILIASALAIIGVIAVFARGSSAVRMDTIRNFDHAAADDKAKLANDMDNPRERGLLFYIVLVTVIFLLFVFLATIPAGR